MTNSVTAFLPIIIIAYVCIRKINHYLRLLHLRGSDTDVTSRQEDFDVDTSRFLQVVLYPSVTAQTLSVGGTVILTYLGHIAWPEWQAFRNYQPRLTSKRSLFRATDPMSTHG